MKVIEITVDKLPNNCNGDCKLFRHIFGIYCPINHRLNAIQYTYERHPKCPLKEVKIDIPNSCHVCPNESKNGLYCKRTGYKSITPTIGIPAWCPLKTKEK